MPTLTLSRNGKSKRDLDVVELASLIDAAGPIAHAHTGLWSRAKGDGRAEAALIAYYGANLTESQT